MIRVCHLYWDGSPLSYLQYLTVVSFKKHNPDWTVKLWMPKHPYPEKPYFSTMEQAVDYTGKDYLEKTKKLCEVIVVDLTEWGITKQVPESMKSDLVRWKLLYDEGGVYSDFDILYVKPVELAGTYVHYNEYPAVGFYVAEPKQQVFADVFDRAWDLYNRNFTSTYQALGSEVWRDMFGSFEGVKSRYPNVQSLSDAVVYPYTPEQIEELFFGDTNRTTPETIGIHWYNGHELAKRYQNDFDKYKNNKSLISKLVKDV